MAAWEIFTAPEGRRPGLIDSPAAMGWRSTGVTLHRLAIRRAAVQRLFDLYRAWRDAELLPDAQIARWRAEVESIYTLL